MINVLQTLYPLQGENVTTPGNYPLALYVKNYTCLSCKLMRGTHKLQWGGGGGNNKKDIGHLVIFPAECSFFVLCCWTPPPPPTIDVKRQSHTHLIQAICILIFDN